MSLDYNLVFSIKSNTNDSATPVRLRVSFNRLRPELYTGISVKPSEWDKTSQRTIIKNDPRNLKLNQIEEFIGNLFKEYDFIEKRFPTDDEFKSRYNTIYGKKKQSILSGETIYNFAKLIDEFSTQKGELDSWTKSNYSRFNKLKNHFSYFNDKLLVKDVTEDDLIKFVKYFQNKPIDIKTGNPGEPHKNTTVARTMKDVRAVLKWAKNKKNIYEGNLHETFYPKFKGSNFDLNEPIFLSWERLIKFYEYKFPPEQKHLEVTRDIIAFCAFSSIRYSDAYNLKKHQLRDDFFYLNVQKTTDALKIDLNDYTKEIIEKYKDHPGNKVLPTKSNKEANEQIKKIGEILEFNEPVSYIYFIADKKYEEVYPFYEMMSTHIGRKTFIVNSLYLGIPAEVIMKWTGHKDYETMKPYIAIVDGLKRKEMDKFNKKK